MTPAACGGGVGAGFVGLDFFAAVFLAAVFFLAAFLRGVAYFAPLFFVDVFFVVDLAIKQAHFLSQMCYDNEVQRKIPVRIGAKSCIASFAPFEGKAIRGIKWLWG